MKKLTLLFTFFAFILGTMNIAICKEQQIKEIICSDKEPISMGWRYDREKGWHINAIFQEGIVDCFFRESPSSKNGLDLDKQNMPYKIAFTHFPTNQYLCSDEISYGQTANGDVYFVSTLKGNINTGLVRYHSVIVSIDENVKKETCSVSYIIHRL